MRAVSPAPERIHPIEVASYEVLRSRVDLSHLPTPERAVAERVVHASADVHYAVSLVFAPGACEAGIEALRAGGVVVCDTEMVRHGITGAPTACGLDHPRVAALVATRPGTTRSAAGMALAAEAHPRPAVVCVGNAPTALDEAIELTLSGRWAPALLVGLPVGFIGAAEAKSRLASSGLPAVTNVGERGGSAVACAAVNALWRLV